MTTFFLTCGTSILGNLRGSSRTDVEDAEKWAEENFVDGARAVLGLPDCLPQMLVGKPRGERRAISAEWDSLYEASPAPTPGPGDRVVLAVSSTSGGVLAGWLNAHLIGGDIFLYESCPLAEGVRPYKKDFSVVGPRVYVVHVPGLRPEHPDEFPAAMAELAKTLWWAARNTSNLVLHLAGGFKATIPFVTAIAEFLPMLTDRTLNIDTYCLHERARDAPASRPGQVTAIPLRSWSGNTTPQDLRAELEAAVQNKSPSSEHLKGWAWTRGDGRHSLTELGVVLLKLFGEVG